MHDEGIDDSRATRITINEADAKLFGRNLFMARRHLGLPARRGWPGDRPLEPRCGLQDRDGPSLAEAGHRPGARRHAGRRSLRVAGRTAAVTEAPPAATLTVMAKQSKKPADLNRLAAAIVGDATDEMAPEPESRQAAAGRLGGQGRRCPRRKTLRREAARDR